MKKLLLMLAAMAFIAVGCTEDPLEPENPGQDGTEQTPGTGDNGEEPGENPGGEDPENPGGEDPENPGGEDPENPGGEDPENPGENPEEPTLPGTEISLFDFAQLPNTDETLYRVSGVVWTVDVEDNGTMVILGTRLYDDDDDDFDPTKDAVAGIMNPTWLKDLNPALRPGHVLTVVGNRGAFGDDPDGEAMILNSQYVSHVEYSEPYLTFDMYVKSYLQSEAGEHTFNVYSNSEWTVTAPEGTSVTPSSGSGCAEVTFKYPANANFQDAFYPVVFNYSGKTAEIEFQQEAVRYSLELSENHVEVAADATTASVEVLSNGSWTVNAPEGVTATPTSGNGNATVTFTFPENTKQELVQYAAQVVGKGNDGMEFVLEFIIDQAAAEVVIPSGIANIKSVASTDGAQFNVILKDAIVTYVSENNAYVEDANDGILIYLSNHGLKAGEKIDGEVSGTVKLYNNLREITALDLSKAEKSSSTYIPVTELTLSELAADYDKYENRRILVKDVEMTAEKEMTQNGQKYALYFKKTPLTGFDMYNRVNVIGYPGKYYENVQFNVFENAEVLGATKTVFAGFSNMEVTVGESKANAATPSSGATVTYESLNTSVATVDQKGVVTGVSEGTATITAKVDAYNGYPAAEATCVVTVLPAGTVVEKAWTLVTDASTLAAGDKIIIVAKNANFAMSTTQNTNNRAQAAVTKSGNTLTFTSEVQEITLEAGTKTGTFAFNVGSSRYLYAASSSKNYLKTGSKDDNASWKIEIATTGVATIKAQGANTRNWLRYNSSNNPPIFSCYGSGQTDVVIYKYQ